MRFLALVFGWWVYEPYSALIALILRARGIHVGGNFYIQGVPYLKLRGAPGNIRIGNNVRVHGDIDLRNRENGRIDIGNDVSFDTGCRLVAANDAVLSFREGADIGGFCIFNCGTHVSVGEGTMMGSYCYIQSSNHGISRSRPIKGQPHTYGEIHIGADVWLAGHVTVLAGVRIGQGAVVGAKAVVSRDVPDYSISVGIPAKVIGERPE